jgi:hypothetical protein
MQHQQQLQGLGAKLKGPGEWGPKEKKKEKKMAKEMEDEEKCESRGVASASLLLGLYFPAAYFFSFVSVWFLWF